MSFFSLILTFFKKKKKRNQATDKIVLFFLKDIGINSVFKSETYSNAKKVTLVLSRKEGVRMSFWLLDERLHFTVLLMHMKNFAVICHWAVVKTLFTVLPWVLCIRASVWKKNVGGGHFLESFELKKETHILVRYFTRQFKYLGQL